MLECSGPAARAALGNCALSISQSRRGPRREGTRGRGQHSARSNDIVLALAVPIGSLLLASCGSGVWPPPVRRPSLPISMLSTPPTPAPVRDVPARSLAVVWWHGRRRHSAGGILLALHHLLWGLPHASHHHAERQGVVGGKCEKASPLQTSAPTRVCGAARLRQRPITLPFVTLTLSTAAFVATACHSLCQVVATHASRFVFGAAFPTICLFLLVVLAMVVFFPCDGHCFAVLAFGVGLSRVFVFLIDSIAGTTPAKTTLRLLRLGFLWISFFHACLAVR